MQRAPIYLTDRGWTDPAIDVGTRMREHTDAKCMNGPRCTGPGCNLETGKTEKNRNRRGYGN